MFNVRYPVTGCIFNLSGGDEVVNSDDIPLHGVDAGR